MDCSLRKLKDKINQVKICNSIAKSAYIKKQVLDTLLCCKYKSEIKMENYSFESKQVSVGIKRYVNEAFSK